MDDKNDPAYYQAMVDDDVDDYPTLDSELTQLLNKYSAENNSGTPDYILADFLLKTLTLFNETVNHRAEWRGESTVLPALLRLQEELEPTANQKDETLSPYCMRCITEPHSGYPHYNHETNEHDAWWSRRESRELDG